MANIISKLKKRTERIQRHKKKRNEIMGETGAIRQNMRNSKAVIKAAVTPGDSVAKARGRQAVKRVGEYRRTKAAKSVIKAGLTGAAMGKVMKGGKKKSKAQFAPASKAKQHKTDF